MLLDFVQIGAIFEQAEFSLIQKQKDEEALGYRADDGNIYLGEGALIT